MGSTANGQVPSRMAVLATASRPFELLQAPKELASAAGGAQAPSPRANKRRSPPPPPPPLFVQQRHLQGGDTPTPLLEGIRHEGLKRVLTEVQSRDPGGHERRTDCPLALQAAVLRWGFCLLASL